MDNPGRVANSGAGNHRGSNHPGGPAARFGQGAGAGYEIQALRAQGRSDSGEGTPEKVAARVAVLYDEYEAAGRRVAIMATAENAASYGERTFAVVGSRQDLGTVAANLFDLLRRFDDQGIKVILAEGVDMVGLGPRCNEPTAQGGRLQDCQGVVPASSRVRNGYKPTIQVIQLKGAPRLNVGGSRVVWKTVITTFSLVFLAELGDKTQLATMLLAAESHALWSVLGSATALVLSSLIGVVAGGLNTGGTVPLSANRCR